MVISNLGSIVLSLPSAGSSATANAAQQVRLLSFFNTISRLLVGPLADVIAPVASRLESGVWGFAGKRHTSRVAFMLGICALLSVTFAWLNVGVRTQEDIWPLRYVCSLHSRLSCTRLTSWCPTASAQGSPMERRSPSCKYSLYSCI